jgi:hypothetical protein
MKGTHMNCLAAYYVQASQQWGLVIQEQNLGEITPLYDITCDISLHQACVKDRHSVDP